jgi:hypothetical protein
MQHGGGLPLILAAIALTVASAAALALSSSSTEQHRQRASDRALVVLDHAIQRVLAFPPLPRRRTDSPAQPGIGAQAPHCRAQRMIQIAQIDRHGNRPLLCAGREIVVIIVGLWIRCSSSCTLTSRNLLNCSTSFELRDARER